MELGWIGLDCIGVAEFDLKSLSREKRNESLVSVELSLSNLILFFPESNIENTTLRRYRN